MSHPVSAEVQNADTQTDVELRQIRDELRQLTTLLTCASSRRPILLYSLRHPHLGLVEPLSVALEYDEGQVVAYAPDLDLFGYGDTENEALDDLRCTVADLYYTLKQERGSLGPLSARVWDYLDHVIAEAES
jgi:hypothetical protein